MNDNNENKSSINKYSNLTFRNNNDLKYNINRSKQFYKKSNINQIVKDANRDKKHNNKFIENKNKK